jgi:hypothetical protein
MKLSYYIGTRNPNGSIRSAIFDKAEKIDLFEGETVMYRGKLVDADNIEAVFNDLVNTFTVPASPKNNKIFKNWFEIGVKGGFNPNLRVDCYIEYNTLPFRSGKTQLEKIKNKDGKINSYAITFYGELTGLDDIFNEDKLSDLDFSSFDFTYNRRNITALFSTPSLVLNESLSRVPSLIMPTIVPASREIQYNTGSSANVKDITKDEGRLFLQDFRPAIRQYRIIEAIESKYGISFSREFLDSTDFTSLYTWLNGNEDFDNIRNWERLQVSSFIDSDDYFSFENNRLNLKFNTNDLKKEVKADGRLFDPNKVYRVTLRTKFQYNNLPAGVKFELRYIDNAGNVLARANTTTVTNQGETGTMFIDFDMLGNSTDLFSLSLKLEIRSNEEIQFTGNKTYRSFYILSAQVEDDPGANGFTEIRSSTGGSLVNNYTYTPFFKISENMPDITVLDYLKNLIKEYKLIIRPNSTTNFRLQNINDYYAEGNVIDITKYSDQESEESIVYKNNKTIEYKYSVEEDSVLQKQFKKATGRFRGNNTKNFQVDNKKSTTIELKTEIPFFVRLTDTLLESFTNINIAIYSSVEKGEIDAIFPTNMLSFYYNGIAIVQNSGTPLPVKLDLSAKPTDDITPTLDILELFGVPICDSSNNYVSSQVSNNLDFSDTTINGWHQSSLIKNIYNQNHKPWIDNLLNSDSRLMTLESVLPPSVVNKIDLNSQIIYKNNKYSIEEFDIDLTTNDAKFTLFPDFNNQYLISETSINRNFFNFNAGGGFSNIVVRTDKKIDSVSDNASWITIGEISGNRRVYNIPFFVNENYKDSQRNGFITLIIGGVNYVININQSLRVGTLNNTQLTISPTNRVLNSSVQEFTIDVQSNGFWTIGDLPENIELLSNDLGFGNETSVFKITENTTGSLIDESFIIFPLTEQSFKTFNIRQNP